MTWLIWRRHRVQLAAATSALAAFVILLIVTHHYMAREYHHFLQTCNQTDTCDQASSLLYSGTGYSLLEALHRLTLLIPVLIGVFLGTPLAGKDFEDGTHKLIWTQTTTRLRWITTKTAWALLITVVCTALASFLITWWFGPQDAINHSRFLPEYFDVQGLVPIGYSIFALGAGILGGAIFKRVLPAIGTTIAGFVITRILVDTVVRQHYQSALTRTIPLVDDGGSNAGSPLGSVWTLAEHVQDSAGHIFNALRFGPGSPVFSMCPPPPLGSQPGKGGLVECLAAHGYTRIVTYQPANRFWTFQGIEFGIFTIVGLLLITLAMWRINRMDA